MSDTVDTWGQLAPFAQSPLNRLAYLFISSGHWTNPQFSIPVMRLSQLAEKVGPDISQVRGAFGTSNIPTTFRALWNHDSQYATKVALDFGQHLTRREAEVLKLVARGMGNRDIAGYLGLAERTVKGHLMSIFGKLGVGSRTEAVHEALKRGWVNLENE